MVLYAIQQTQTHTHARRATVAENDCGFRFSILQAKKKSTLCAVTYSIMFSFAEHQYKFTFCLLYNNSGIIFI